LNAFSSPQEPPEPTWRREVLVAELLSEGAADDPEAPERFLRNISLDVERLDRLVSRLLEQSRIEAAAGALAVVDLRGLVEQAVERAQTPDGSVVLDYPSAPTVVTGREADLAAALNNLVDNALRFSPPDETVLVRVRRTDSSRVAIEVVDHGPGVDPANRPRLFERFFSTEAEGDGTGFGLGLAIVKSVALAHGGTATAESVLGEDATFRLALPVL
jgi:two-component system sensor histidine kinase ChvG